MIFPSLSVAGKRNGDRVRSQHPFGTPQRCDDARGVCHCPADLIALQRLEDVVARDTKVIGVADRDPRRAALIGLLHGDVIGLWCDDQPETVVAVDRSRRTRFANHPDRWPWIQSAEPQHCEVRMQPRDAMRVDPSQVAQQKNIGRPRRLSFLHAAEHENALHELSKLISGKNCFVSVWHGSKDDSSMGGSQHVRQHHGPAYC